jgi:hypothetical protein
MIREVQNILTSPSVDGATFEYLDSQTTSVNVLGLCFGTLGKESSQLYAKYLYTCKENGERNVNVFINAKHM